MLKAVGARPRRTIRIALWGGEEQGLLGSRAYVKEHFADVETMALKPDHARVAAYFNSDNGTGRVRGVWLQGNLAVGPIFEQWIAPLKDLGVTTLGPRSVAQTDHVSFDNVGIPAFQFLVERLEYNSRTHHSTMDTFDRIQRDDMIMTTHAAHHEAAKDEESRKAFCLTAHGSAGLLRKRTIASGGSHASVGKSQRKRQKSPQVTDLRFDRHVASAAVSPPSRCSRAVCVRPRRRTSVQSTTARAFRARTR